MRASAGYYRSRAIARFPVVAHASGRYLVDADGVPFIVKGRNTWSLCELNRPAAVSVLDDCVARGFNTIEVWPPNLFANGTHATLSAWRDGAGNYAFTHQLGGAAFTGTGDPDYATPNPAYFAFVRQFLEDCRVRGILVLMFNAYVGFPGANPIEGHMAIMVANGTTKCQNYGAYIGATFSQDPNVVWMIGGDRGTGDGPFSGDELAAHSAYVDGLTSVTTRSTLYSAEWKRNHAGLAGSLATDLYDGDPINLNGTYASETQINNQGERAWAHSPAYPAFVLESPFSNHPNGTDGPPRRFSWWSWLSHIGGYVTGDWDYYLFLAGYQAALGNSVVRDHQVLNAVIDSVAWHTLVPDQTVISAGGGTADTSTEVRFALNAAGTLAMGYRPPAHTGTITIDRSKMSAAFNVSKIDPVTRAETSLFTGLTNTGTQELTFSGTNGAGETDWGIQVVVP